MIWSFISLKTSQGNAVVLKLRGHIPELCLVFKDLCIKTHSLTTIFYFLNFLQHARLTICLTMQFSQHLSDNLILWRFRQFTDSAGLFFISLANLFFRFNMFLFVSHAHFRESTCSREFERRIDIHWGPPFIELGTVFFPTEHGT